MRILVVSNLYPPVARGGAENIAKKTAEELVAQGHEVTVLSTSSGIQDLTSSKEGSVNVYRYRPSLPYHILEDTDQPMWRRVVWHAKDYYGSGAGRIAQQVLDEVKPDIVMTHNLRGMGMSVVKAFEGKVPWVHVLHDVQLLVPSGLFWLDRSSPLQSSVALWLHQTLLRRRVGSPDLVIGPTNYIIDTHKESGFFPESEGFVLQNPVAESSERADLHMHKPLSLLYVGQLAPNKGVHVLLEALSHVGRLPVELNIVGEGSERTRLTELALTLPDTVKVTLHGRVPHEQVVGYMKRADAVMLPSVAVENCPGVILEARSVHARVVASDVGGVGELVHPTGLVVSGNARALAQKIEDLAHGGVEALDSSGLLSPTTYVHQLITALSSIVRR